MVHHAKHARASEKSSALSHVRRTIPLLGLAAVGVGVAAPAAHADDLFPDVPGSAAREAGDQQLGGMALYPVAGSPLDVLSNNVRVPVGGMDVSTFPVTAPLRDGLPLREVPVVGTLLPS